MTKQSNVAMSGVTLNGGDKKVQYESKKSLNSTRFAHTRHLLFLD